MSLRRSLIGVSAIAVVADAMLLPFYPQYFASRFGETSPEHVGAYLAAICVAVMVALPLWARVARGRHPLKVLLWSQPVAALLCVGCYAATSLAGFWAVSLAMICVKASYLLMYPYVMGLTAERDRAHVIGALSVVVHFGAILGAVAGGLALEALEPRDIFLVMALGDLLQTAVIAWVLRGRPPAVGSEPASVAGITGGRRAAAVYRLCAVMIAFYFSAYLARPFFTLWWQDISTFDGPAVTGLVFAIPGVVALAALALNRRAAIRGASGLFENVAPACALGFVGLLMQAAPSEALVVVGRCLFGWAAFQLTVGLDAKLFALSTPTDYARDFAKVSVAQNLGVVLASFAAGGLVGGYGLAAPFLAAAAGLALTALVHRATTTSHRDAAASHLSPAEFLCEESATSSPPPPCGEGKGGGGARSSVAVRRKAASSAQPFPEPPPPPAPPRNGEGRDASRASFAGEFHSGEVKKGVARAFGSSR